jgi:hypothetical protein
VPGHGAGLGLADEAGAARSLASAALLRRVDTRAPAPARSLRGREAARGRAQSLACLGSAAVPTAPLPRTLQGEGGLFHGDSYKQRFFVLARVPHASESARRRGAGCCPPPSVARLTPTLRLFRPPFAAAVLIYYGEKTMDEENILGAQAFARAGTRYAAAAAAATFAPLFLSSAVMPAGFIDLRKVQAVREGLKSIVLDGPKQGLMTKLFTRGAPPAPLSR